MRILFVATPNGGGHHITYFNSLVASENYQSIALLPEEYNLLTCKQIVRKDIKFCPKNIIEYRKFIKAICSVVNQEKIDIVHIQCGNNFNRYFGLFFSCIPCKTVVTFHHFRRGILRDISTKRIFKNISVGIVHTMEIEKGLNKIAIKNVEHIEYPSFISKNVVSISESRKYFGLNENSKVLVALGGTRYDKGLDILLRALRNVNEEFQLLIAGSEDSIKKDMINELINPYKDRVKLCIKFLSDEEFLMALKAADFVILPYRKIFEGASGPLGEGVVLNKTIIGPSHGSLGNIIHSNHLGYIFESENENSLARTILKALKSEFIYDGVARNYKSSLSVDIFRKKYLKLFNNLYHI